MKQYRHSKQTIVFSVNSETYKAAAEIAKRRGMHLHEFVRQLLYRELSGLKRFD